MKKMYKIMFVLLLLNMQLFSDENIENNCTKDLVKPTKYLDQKTADYINQARCKNKTEELNETSEIIDNNSSDINVSIETNIVIDNNTSISIKGSLIIEENNISK